MKKLLCLCLISLLFISGCDKKYNEGTFEGSAIDTYGGENNTATAKIEIDENGKITSVYLDTTYTKDGVSTTKKQLKDDYGMYNHPYGSEVGEWYQQVEALEQAIVENQGIEFLNLDEDGYTDAVSSCTIKVDALIEAFENALNKAK